MVGDGDDCFLVGASLTPGGRVEQIQINTLSPSSFSVSSVAAKVIVLDVSPVFKVTLSGTLEKSSLVTPS